MNAENDIGILDRTWRPIADMWALHGLYWISASITRHFERAGRRYCMPPGHLCWGELDVAHLLLERGADIDAEDDNSRTADFVEGRARRDCSFVDKLSRTKAVYKGNVLRLLFGT